MPKRKEKSNSKRNVGEGLLETVAIRDLRNTKKESSEKHEIKNFEGNVSKGLVKSAATSELQNTKKKDIQEKGNSSNSEANVSSSALKTKPTTKLQNTKKKKGNNSEANVSESFVVATATTSELPNTKKQDIKTKPTTKLQNTMKKRGNNSEANVSEDFVVATATTSELPNTKKQDIQKNGKLRQLAKLTMFDSNIASIQPQFFFYVNFNSLIYTVGSKYKDLFMEMSTNIYNLRDGYDCLESFRHSEVHAKQKKAPACVKGFSIGKIRFVLRKTFGKLPDQDTITPKRFAAVVTLSADKMFREKLAFDPVAMETAYKVVKNSLARAHGFSVNKIPKTDEQIKLYYYYLVTTIGLYSLMDVNPISCMAVSRWRLDGNNAKKLGLHKKAVNENEILVRCLSDIRAEQKYIVNTENATFRFIPEAVIDSKKNANKSNGRIQVPKNTCWSAVYKKSDIK